MKRIKKKILGFLGLFLVAAVTTFAILMPSREASALGNNDTTSLTYTEKIRVTVEGEKLNPRVSFLEPVSGTVFDTPEHTFRYSYSDVTSGKVEVDYTDEKGVMHTYVLDEFVANNEASERTFTLNFDEDIRFGFGKYKMRLVGNTDEVENATEDVIEFSYYVFEPTLPGGTDDNGIVKGPGSSEQNPMTENPVVHFGISPSNPFIDHVEVNVYDEDGNLVEELSPQTVVSPFEDLELQFQEHGLPSGWYTVEIQAYDNNGEPYGDKKVIKFYYKAPELPVPNAGAPFVNLNISKQDYLITGMVIFGLAAVIGAMIVVRRKATAKRKK